MKVNPAAFRRDSRASPTGGQKNGPRPRGFNLDSRSGLGDGDSRSRGTSPPRGEFGRQSSGAGVSGLRRREARDGLRPSLIGHVTDLSYLRATYPKTIEGHALTSLRDFFYGRL